MVKKNWEQKKSNYRKALDSLNEAIVAFSKNTQDRVVRAGLIQNFEFCLELAWKLQKFDLEQKGFADASSPKAVIRTAYEQGLIEDGALWLQMLDDRNDSSHNYDEGQAQNLANKIVSSYAPAFQSLYDKIN